MTLEVTYLHCGSFSPSISALKALKTMSRRNGKQAKRRSKPKGKIKITIVVLRLTMPFYNIKGLNAERTVPLIHCRISLIFRFRSYQEISTNVSFFIIIIICLIASEILVLIIKNADSKLKDTQDTHSLVE